jgi:hypothetical protein
MVLSKLNPELICPTNKRLYRTLVDKDHQEVIRGFSNIWFFYFSQLCAFVLIIG